MSNSRTRSVFFPYIYGDETLRLSLGDCSLDGKPFNPGWDDALLECDLSKADPWETGRLRITVEQGEKEMWVPELVPSSERKAPPVQLLATMHCGSTLRRWRTEGTLDLRAGKGALELELRRADLKGFVDLNVYIVRRQGQTADLTYAADPAARLIASRRATIRVDSPGHRLGLGLPIEWESFRSSKHPFRSNHSAALFHLDTALTPPTLYLNKDAGPDLYAVMSEEAPRGRKAALRNLLFSAIAMPVWDSLVRAAIKAVDSDGNIAVGWERHVLLEVAVAAEPASEPNEALRKLIQDLRDGSGGRGIEERLPIAISEMVQFRLRAEQSTGALL